jgi:hypothetical protein
VTPLETSVSHPPQRYPTVGLDVVAYVEKKDVWMILEKVG